MKGLVGLLLGIWALSAPLPGRAAPKAQVVALKFDTFRARFQDIFSNSQYPVTWYPQSLGVWIYDKQAQRFLTDNEKFEFLNLKSAFPFLHGLPATLENHLEEYPEYFRHYPYASLFNKVPIKPGDFHYIVLFNDISEQQALAEDNLILASFGSSKPGRVQLVHYLEETLYGAAHLLVYRPIH
ncbi:hypothetical protein [Gallaecimonas pentaromativorans]|uniref:hypothetical protein n=1 Tax=Gallaecimonas pentaromativorans TaxID=584787 RepID=UPI003A91BB5C